MKNLLIPKIRFHLFVGIVASCLFFSTFPLYAQRIDVVTMRNGDQVTGEIRKMVRGILYYKTDDMGTLNIEWIKVDFIQSLDRFDVETRWGQHFIGSLENGEEKNRL